MPKWILGALVAIAASSGVANAEVREFSRPRIDGMRLDWCLTWAQNCGRPAASAFCRRRGYDYAEDFAKESGVGDYEPTRLITGATCGESFCTGFAYITCGR